jgi:hypothetical protein
VWTVLRAVGHHRPESDKYQRLLAAGADCFVRKAELTTDLPPIIRRVM